MFSGFRSGLDIPEAARAVGNVSACADDPDPITEVRGTDGGSGNAVPLRVIPELGQIAKDCPHSSVSSKEPWDVLHEDVAGS
jgi:hypothetical protein